MRVLVTGSSGFIGKHTVDALVKRGHVVGHADKRISMDLAEPGVAAGILSFGYDLIIHHASVMSTQGSIDRPMETFRDTVQSAAYVLEAARYRQTPVIITSSVKARDGKTPYGAAKQMVEAWAREYRDTYGLPVIINRPGTVYGPGQEGSTESGWIAWFLKAKREGLPVVINGDGSQVRDLLHVSDYVALLVRQAEHFEVYDGGVWDVGGGRANAVSVRGMAEMLELEYTHGPARTGDVDIYIGYNDAPDWQPLMKWQMSEVFRDLL